MWLLVIAVPLVALPRGGVITILFLPGGAHVLFYVCVCEFGEFVHFSPVLYDTSFVDVAKSFFCLGSSIGLIVNERVPYYFDM